MPESKSSETTNEVSKPTTRGPIDLEEIGKLSRLPKKEERKFVPPGSRILDAKVETVSNELHLNHDFTHEDPPFPVTEGYDEVFFSSSDLVVVNLEGVVVNIKGWLPNGEEVDKMQPLPVAKINLARKGEDLFLIVSDTTQETVKFTLPSTKKNEEVVETLRILKIAEPPSQQPSSVLSKALQAARKEALSSSSDIREIMQKLSQGIFAKNIPQSS